MSTPADQRPLTPTEADAAIALLRAGGTAVIEAGRAGWSLHFKDESFHVDEWEEQDNSTSKVSEEFVRSTLAKHPAAFHRLLLKAPWEAFRRAFVADNRPVARELLQRTREHGDEHFDFLDAFLGWPQEKPSPEAVAQIRAHVAQRRAFREAGLPRPDMRLFIGGDGEAASLDGATRPVPANQRFWSSRRRDGGSVGRRGDCEAGCGLARWLR